LRQLELFAPIRTKKNLKKPFDTVFAAFEIRRLKTAQKLSVKPLSERPEGERIGVQRGDAPGIDAV
jgi:hypothetical protein